MNGRVYSANRKITLIVRNFDSIETRELKYASGLRYPHLERIPGIDDLLSKILAPQNKQQ